MFEMFVLIQTHILLAQVREADWVLVEECVCRNMDIYELCGSV